MRKITGALLVIIAFTALGVISTAHAVPMWGTDASGELTGSRSEPANLRTTGTTGGGPNPNNWTGYVLSWNVTYDTVTELWTYVYTSPAGPPPANSHLWLEITDGVLAADIDINGKLVGPQTYSGSSSSDNDGWPTYDDDGFPATEEIGIPVYALKFDFGPDPYEIITERAPVYGNFFSKGGNSYVWNLGMETYDGTSFLSENISDFIVRPDGISNGGGGGGSSVPEPGTILLLGGGLLVTALNARGRKE